MKHTFLTVVRCLFRDERAAMKQHCACPATVEAPHLKRRLVYAPLFRSGYLAHAFSNRQMQVGDEIAWTGANHLTYADGSRVDTDRLFKPIGWEEIER